MRGQDIVAVIGTFVIGLVCGWYLYVFGFSIQFGEVAELVEGESLVINGEAYGGCERAGYCASYQIAADGSYRALAASANRSAEREVKEGAIPEEWRRDLQKTFTSAKLKDLTEPYQKATCAADVDGIEYYYSIQLGETIYELDTCTTAIAADDDARSLLQDLFLYMEL